MTPDADTTQRAAPASQRHGEVLKADGAEGNRPRRSAERPERPNRPPPAGTPADPAPQEAVGEPQPPHQVAHATQEKQAGGNLGRPPGELGGHTVQEWEQKAVGSGTGSTSRSTPSVPATSKGDMGATSQADFPAKAAAEPAPVSDDAVGGTPGGATARGGPAQTPEGGSSGAVQRLAPGKASPDSPTNAAPASAGIGHEALVDAIATSLGHMFARALKQSVAEAVEEALGKGAAAGAGGAKPLPPAAPNTGSMQAGQAQGTTPPPNVKNPPKPGPAAA